MTKSISYTLLTLIILTIITALVSSFVTLKVGVYFILFLSSIKFVLVSFQFMEMKKANIFWKILILLFLIIFITITFVVV